MKCMNPAKFIVYTLAFVFVSGQSYGQMRRSEFWKDTYSRQDFYIPDERTAVCTLHINLNFWQKDDGSGNWQQTEEHIKRLERIALWLDNIFKHICVPSDSLPGTAWIRDSKMRVVVDGMYFYRNTEMWGKYTHEGDALNAYLGANHPERLHAFNIHVTGGSSVNGKAYGQASGSSYRMFDHWIVTLNNEADEVGDYAWAQHLGHEIGHNLGLHHPYNSEYLQAGHPDFLDDVFVPSTQIGCKPARGNDVCYHYTNFSCDVFAPDNSCTNNLMGGTREACYLSPKQMGRMHRSIATHTFGRYFTGYSPYSLVIARSEVWDFDYRSFRDIEVRPGVTLVIKGKLIMQEGTSLILHKGAVLQTDGGSISGSGQSFSGSTGRWKGIVHVKKKKRGTILNTNGGYIADTGD